GKVAFGAGALDRTASETQASRDHRVRLEGLVPDTRYRYRVDAPSAEEGAFWTAPSPSTDPAAQVPFRVLVYGDNRSHPAAHQEVARAAQREDARLALHTGDMVADAKRDDLWAVWFGIEHKLLAATPLVATVGNHEITDR